MQGKLRNSLEFFLKNMKYPFTDIRSSRNFGQTSGIRPRMRVRDHNANLSLFQFNWR